MPVERKPLFRPDVLHGHLKGFHLPTDVEASRPKLQHWAELIKSGKADKLNEKELLPDFLTDVFVSVLGYKGPAGGSEHYTLSREKHVEVDGKVADAVLGDFNAANRPVVALDGDDLVGCGHCRNGSLVVVLSAGNQECDHDGNRQADGSDSTEAAKNVNERRVAVAVKHPGSVPSLVRKIEKPPSALAAVFCRWALSATTRHCIFR